MKTTDARRIRIWCKLGGAGSDKKRFKVIGLNRDESALKQISKSLLGHDVDGRIELCDTLCGSDETAEIDDVDLIRPNDKILFIRNTPTIIGPDEIYSSEGGEEHMGSGIATTSGTEEKRSQVYGLTQSNAPIGERSISREIENKESSPLNIGGNDLSATEGKGCHTSQISPVKRNSESDKEQRENSLPDNNVGKSMKDQSSVLTIVEKDAQICHGKGIESTNHQGTIVNVPFRDIDEKKSNFSKVDTQQSLNSLITPNKVLEVNKKTKSLFRRKFHPVAVFHRLQQKAVPRPMRFIADSIENIRALKKVPQHDGYSKEGVRKRTRTDGTIKPVKQPRLSRKRGFIRPAGRGRKGMAWDSISGTWVPCEREE